LFLRGTYLAIALKQNHNSIIWCILWYSTNCRRSNWVNIM
jgi:hypothetical protein